MWKRMDIAMDMMIWIEENYPEPKWYWTKIHTDIRNAELVMFEMLIVRCLDSLSREPEDIIDDMLFELCMSEKRCQKPENKLIRNKCYKALERLSNYLKGGKQYYYGEE